MELDIGYNPNINNPNDKLNNNNLINIQNLGELYNLCNVDRINSCNTYVILPKAI